MITGSVLYQQSLKEVVGYRQTVGADITCVLKFQSPRTIVIVETSNTASTHTFSVDEKRANKHHRNIDCHVSPSIYIGAVAFN